MSTIAHHASHLTLTAGLGGGRGARRDVNMSGAEYDPDRPVNAMVASIASNARRYTETEPLKSKRQVRRRRRLGPVLERPQQQQQHLQTNISIFVIKLMADY